MRGDWRDDLGGLRDISPGETIDRAVQARAEAEIDLARCRDGACDSGYPCPLHRLAPRMVEALRLLLAGSERSVDMATITAAIGEARAIVRELGGGA